MESNSSISWRESLIDSVVVLFFVSLSLVIFFRLWTFHPHIPIHYDGDGLPVLGAFRNFQDHNWYFYSSKVGYPYGQHLQDFPAPADGFSLTLGWLLVKVLRDPVLAFNALFFLTYPITALAGYFGARLLTLTRVSSIVIGVLFAFAPYHALHGAPHLFLSMYAIIPVVVGFVFREVRGIASPNKAEDQSRVKRYLPYVAVGLAASVSGLYYAFFSLIFIAIGMVFILIDEGKFQNIRKLAVSIGATFIGLVLQFLPIISFQQQYGSNLDVAKRNIADVEGYPLRLIDLLLPVPWHHINLLANFSNKNRSTFVPGEANAFFGTIGALGVIILLIAIFSPSRKFFRESGIQLLARFFLFFLLASVVGGFNQILAAIGFTQIRVWSRSAVFLAFIAVASFFLVFESIHRRYRIKSSFYFLIMCVLLIGGLWDTNRFIPKDAYAWNSLGWQNDQQIVEEIETTFGAGARVLQLPILKFPEQGPVEQLTDYAQLRGSLHSRSLCWSYGVVSGRDDNRTATWQALSLTKQIEQARLQGFDVVWVEMRAYPERGINQSEALSAILGPPVLTDSLNLVQVFDMREDKQIKRENC